MPTETEEKTPETAIAERPGKVPVLMGVAPKSVEEAWRLAGFLAASELVPKHFRNRQADILVAIQHAMEIGLPPLQGLQSIAVVNGRATLWGDGFLAVIMGCPLYVNHEEYFEVDRVRRDGLTLEDLKHDDTAAVCTFWRRGKPQPVTRRFTIGQARKAGLLDKKDTPWQTYPDRMLAMRARGFAGRDAFPDVLRGIRTAEEAMDTPPEAVIDLPAPEPVQPRRASTARPEPADSPPASSAPAPRGPAKVTTERGLLITGVASVTPPQGDPYVEITLKTGTGAARLVVTRDEAIAREAESFAGTDHAVVITTHEAPRADLNGRVMVLDALAIDDSVVSGTSLFES